MCTVVSLFLWFCRWSTSSCCGQTCYVLFSLVCTYLHIACLSYHCHSVAFVAASFMNVLQGIVLNHNMQPALLLLHFCLGCFSSILVLLWWMITLISLLASFGRSFLCFFLCLVLLSHAKSSYMITLSPSACSTIEQEVMLLHFEQLCLNLSLLA